MITAEEFYRQKIKHANPSKKFITLSVETINAEQAMRWAHEFAQLNYNQALEDAVESVGLKETRDSDEYNEMPSVCNDMGDVYVIDKNSILKLKKSVSDAD